MNFIEEKILHKGNTERLALRFPPEPNGHLHIGHAKSICLNFGLAEKYGAKCNLRFDDTNPTTEEESYVNSIHEDVRWLGYEPSRVACTSDYFGFIFECAKKLIEKGMAYVDDSTSEEMAEMKGTPTSPGKDSPFKRRSIEENLDLFEKMKEGRFPEGSKTLRASIDMASPNMILRDPVIYRIVDKPHHKTGSEWKIYPMYDFAHPLSDYAEGITDSLCTLEFEVHRPLYMWVLESCDLEGPLPEETEFARLNIDWTVMSKRKLKRLVEERHVDGWDDPRMPTISGLRRRGFTPASIREFCEKISVTKRESVVSYSLLEECLRTELNRSAKRIMGVFDPVRLVIENWKGGTEYVEIENNPEDESFGKRMVPFSGEIYIEREDFKEEAGGKFHRLKIGGEVRLKGAYIIRAKEAIKDADGNIESIICEYDPATKSGMKVDRKVKGTIHWVSIEHGIRMKANEYDRLFSSQFPDKEDGDLMEFLNPHSKKEIDNAIFEPCVAECVPGVPVQMVRKGYYVMDRDGSLNKTVSLKEGWSAG